MEILTMRFSMAKSGKTSDGFGLPEWHDSRIDGLASSYEEAADAFLRTMKENAANAAAQRSGLLEVSGARPSQSKSGQLNLQSDLLSLESGLNTLDSGVLDFTEDGTFRFEAADGSVIELNSDLYDGFGSATPEGGLTDALNRFAAADSIPGNQVPPPLSDPNLASSRPAQMTPMIARPAAARSDSPHAPRAAASRSEAPALAVEEEGVRQPPSCRYAAVSLGEPERVRARKVAVKIRMG